MKLREQLVHQAKLITQGKENANAMALQDMFTHECSDQYQKLMKSLNTIKILKIELDLFSKLH
jgi:hypothetical protein